MLHGRAVLYQAAVVAVLTAAEAPHVQISLIAEREHAQPGTTLSLGVHFAMEPGWHIYWHDPGESGAPPRITWGLPDGFVTGPLHWPAPKRLVTGPITNNVYDGDVLLVAPVQIAR